MKLHYLDAGLSSDMGHHSNSCRNVIQEFKRRNISVCIYGAQSVDKDLQKELDIRPYFRWHTYRETIENVELGAIRAFHYAWRHTLEDLRALSGTLDGDDIVYFNSARSAQLMALGFWVDGMQKAGVPTIVAELGSASGLLKEDYQSPSWQLPDLRKDPRPFFYRLAGETLQSAAHPRFHPIAFDASVAESYSALLGVSVKHTSAPRSAVTSCRKRTSAKTIVISVIGEQRPEKGYALMPAIISQVLHQTKQDVCFFIHNARPWDATGLQRTLHDMSLRDSRIEINEQLGTPPLWASFLEKSDLILCPYYPPTYMTSYSAVALEAVSNAIPVVVPAHTSLSKTLDVLPGGTIFSHYSAESISQAVLAAVDAFDLHAEAAYRSSCKWKAELGSGHFAESLLAWHTLST